MSKLEAKIWEISRRLPVLEKSTSGYKFKYVSLEDIIKALNPLLEEYKIGYYHITGGHGDQNVLTTTVFDLEDGKEKVAVSLAIPDNVTLAGMNGYQSLGSALTYFRRYNLVTIFDIIADTDVDQVLPESKAPKKDWIKQVKTLIAEGKNTKAQLEGWFSKNRSLMTPEQRKEGIELIQNVK